MNQHIGDCYPVGVNAVTILQPYLWRAYCTCGWESPHAAPSALRAMSDHRAHLVRAIHWGHL